MHATTIRAGDIDNSLVGHDATSLTQVMKPVDSPSPPPGASFSRDFACGFSVMCGENESHGTYRARDISIAQRVDGRRHYRRKRVRLNSKAASAAARHR